MISILLLASNNVPNIASYKEHDLDSSTFWDRFGFDYRLDGSSLINSLISIEAHRQSASHLVLAPDWMDQLDRLNKVRAVHGTTAIEGNPLSEAEVRAQMERIEKHAAGSFKGKSRDVAQIANAAKGQNWAKERFTPDSPPVSMGDILKMHKLLTEGSDEIDNVPGALRTFPVRVGAPDLGGVHWGAPHDRLAQMMEDFVGFLRSKKLASENPVVQSLLAHFFLVTIHPFGDGNGRVSRLLEAGILFRQGYNVHGFYGLSNFFYRNADKYRILLNKVRRSAPRMDVTEFIQFGVDGFLEELMGINNFVKAKLNRVMYRQMLVASHSRKISPRRRLLNDREVQLLRFLLDETEPEDPFADNPSRRVTLDEVFDSAFMQAAYGSVTVRTVVREFSRLGELGFIKFDTEKRGGFWVEIDFNAIGKYQIS